MNRVIRVLEHLLPVVVAAVALLILTQAAAQTETSEPAQPAADGGATPAGEPAAGTEPDAKAVDPQSFYYYALARDHHKAGRLDEAIAEYKKAAELDPTSVLILRDMAEAYLQKQDFDGARQALLKAMEINPSDLESLYLLARVSQDQSKPQEAEDALKKGLAVEGEARKTRHYALILFRYAPLLEGQERLAEAAEVYERLTAWLADAPEEMNRDVQIRQLIEQRQQILNRAVHLYLRADRRDDAVRLVRATSADEVEAYYRLGRLAGDNVEQSEAFLRKGLAVEGEAGKSRFYGLILYRLAYFLDQQERGADAAEMFEQLVRWLQAAPEAVREDRQIATLVRQESAILTQAVKLYLRAKQYDRAVKLVRETAADFPGIGPLLVLSLLDEQQADLALEAAMEIQRRRPADGTSYRLLARAYEARHDDEGFIKAFREFVKQQPQQTVVKLLLGTKLLGADQADAGGKLIEEVLGRDNALDAVGIETLVPGTVNALLEGGKTDLALKMALAAQKRWPTATASYRLLARAYEQAGDNEGFVETFRRLRDAHPQVTLISLLLGQKLLEMGREEEGAKALEPLLSQNPEEVAAARAVLLDYYKGSDKPEQALKLYAQILPGLDQPPAAGALLDDLGRFAAGLKDARAVMDAAHPLLQSLNEDRKKTVGPDLVLGALAEVYDPALAAEHYQAALEIDPKFAFAYILRTGVLVNDDRLTDVIKMLQSASQQVTHERFSDEFFRLTGIMYELLDRDADALATYGLAYRLNPKETSVTFNLCRVLVRVGRAEEARRLVEKAIADRPDWERSYLNAVYLYADLLRDRQAALSVVDRGLQALPGSLRLMRVRVSILVAEQRYDEASEACDVLAAAPNAEPEAERQRAVLLIAQEKFARAETILRELLDADPDDVDLLYTMAMLYQNWGKADKAEQSLEAILKKQPQHVGANNDLGYRRAERGQQLAESEKMILLALRSQPDSAAFLDSLGWALYKQNRLDRALVYLKRSVRMDSHIGAVVWDHLGDALVRLKRTDEARQAYQQAQKVLKDPGRTVDPGDDEVGKQVAGKLEALASDRPVPVAPLGLGLE